MAQLVTRVEDGLVAELDHLVDCGEAASRSDAVRRALEEMIERRRRRLVGQAIVEAYLHIPETPEELRFAEESTRSMIAEEPWERS